MLSRQFKHHPIGQKKLWPQMSLGQSKLKLNLLAWMEVIQHRWQPVSWPWGLHSYCFTTGTFEFWISRREEFSLRKPRHLSCLCLDENPLYLLLPLTFTPLVPRPHVSIQCMSIYPESGINIKSSLNSSVNFLQWCLQELNKELFPRMRMTPPAGWLQGAKA